MKKIFTLIVALVAISVALTAQPIIGISANDSKTTVGVNMTYINAVRNSGGIPLVIPWTTDDTQLKAILNTIDGLVMTGGQDYDPLAGFAEEPHRNLGEIVPDRDAFDSKLTKMAIERDIPLLGICRGEQGLNVAMGGSLYQDIPSQVKGTFVKHRQNAPNDYGTHTITIDKNSLLYEILGVETTNVNSFHHQAVKDIAPGFKVTAVSKDGIVEAIEKIGSKRILGVQFHPEGFASKGNCLFTKVFDWLVKEASKK